jgi:uncharacterized protein
MIIARDLEPSLIKESKVYSVIALTGPRQSGKTTLVKKCFPDKPYINMELPVERNLFEDDPVTFFNRFPEGAIIDEAQKCPELFSYIQHNVDENYMPGKFILTGSQNFLLLQSITQSLAGRVSMLKLLPFTLNELNSFNLDGEGDIDRIVKGFYPPLFDRKYDFKNWYNNYINLYIERDVRTVLKIHNLNIFKNFLSLCANNVGQLISYSSFASALGVDYRTVASWISVLESSYIIKILPSYHTNFKKRIVKAAKIYFYDTGVLCSLLGFKNVKDLSVTDEHFGNIYENFIIMEIIKSSNNIRAFNDFYFWRDSNGNEVDLIIKAGSDLIPVEIKSSATYHSKFTKGLLKWNELSQKSKNPSLIYRGNEEISIKGIKFIPWTQAAKIIDIGNE